MAFTNFNQGSGQYSSQSQSSYPTPQSTQPAPSNPMLHTLGLVALLGGAGFLAHKSGLIDKLRGGKKGLLTDALVKDAVKEV